MRRGSKVPLAVAALLALACDAGSRAPGEGGGPPTARVAPDAERGVPLYRVTELGALEGSAWATATAISPNGRYVAGVAAPFRSFLWDGAMRDLGIPFSSASAVNDSGIVVGEFMANVRSTRPFRWHAGAWEALEMLGDPLLGSAVAIDGAGTIVGWASTPDGVHAVSWSPFGEIRDLAPATRHSTAHGIAPDSTIVGASYEGDPSYRNAVAFRDGKLKDLGLGHDATAFAAAAGGTVVGSAWFGTEEHGVVRTDGTTIDVGSLPGEPHSRLVAVNTSGVAVGYTYGGALWGRGIIFIDGRLLDLNALIQDARWTIVSAHGIADDGSIVASAIDSVTGELAGAILLRPDE